MAASQHMLILGSAHYTIFVSTIVYGKPSRRGGVSNEAKLFIEFQYGYVVGVCVRVLFYKKCHKAD